MTLTLEKPVGDRDASSPAKPSSAVYPFAAVGAASLVVVAIGWSRWLLSHPSAAPVGPDQWDGWKSVYLQIFQWATFACAPIVLWKFAVKPALRERRLTFDGMLIVGCFTLWFYDPMDNYFNLSFTYNAHFLQFGTWARFIPGYRYPTGYPEPVLFVGAMYVWMLFGFVLLGCAFMRRLRARFPRLSTLSLVSSCVLMASGAVFLMEMLFLRTEVWQYPGASRFLTLWPGTRYQYPVINAFIAGLFFGLLACLRFFRDDKGRSVVERGVERLRLPSWGRRTVSTLAVTGAVHSLLIVMYFVPFSWFIALRVDTFPAMPSYMRAGMCGEGTAYACPGRYVPIPSRTSLHITPDDPRLPQSVRDQQGSPRPRGPGQ